MGHILVVYRCEVAQKLPQPVCLRVFGTVLRHLLQQRFSLLTYHCQLVDHSRVEYRVGILLIWEYPFVLAPLHAGPSMYYVQCRTATVLVVAYDAA